MICRFLHFDWTIDEAPEYFVWACAKCANCLCLCPSGPLWPEHQENAREALQIAQPMPPLKKKKEDHGSTSKKKTYQHPTTSPQQDLSDTVASLTRCTADTRDISQWLPRRALSSVNPPPGPGVRDGASGKSFKPHPLRVPIVANTWK